MQIYKLTSSKGTIERFLMSTNSQAEVNEDEARMWLSEIYDLAGVPSIAITKVIGHKQDPAYEFTDWKVPLPCDFKALKPGGISVNGRPVRWAQNSFHYLLDGECFKAGTLITMSNGTLKEIQDIQVGDKVISAEGNIDTVTDTFNREYDGKIYKANLIGHNLLEATENHTILTDKGYIKISELKKGDYLCVSKSKKNSNDHTILTYNDGLFLGLYLAEGSLDKSRIRFSFNINEEDTLGKFIEDYTLSKFNKEVVKHVRKENCIVYSINSKEACNFISVKTEGNCWSKHIIEDFNSMSDDYKKGIIDGWMLGDGHSRHKERIGASVSPKLALQMFNLANSLNLTPSISRCKAQINKYAKHREDVFKVTIRDNRENFRGIKCNIVNGNFYRAIRKIDIEDYHGIVYNFETKKDHSYIANGIGVHNCCDLPSLNSTSLDTFTDNFGTVFSPSEGITSVSAGYPADVTFNIEDGWITFNVKSGKCCLAYWSYPVDNENYLMIPDTTKFKRACADYLRYKTDYILWRQGLIPDAVFKYSDAEKDWSLGSAKTELLMPDDYQLSSMQRSLIRLMPIQESIGSFYKNLGQQEQSWRRRF